MHKHQQGFVLLVVLIAIAIGVIIYYADLKAIFNLSDDDNTENLMVWEEWQKIEKEGKPKLKFHRDQPIIKEPLKFQTKVILQDQSRGSIEVAIEPNGTVKGKWYGNYSDRGFTESVRNGDFKGIIYPAKMFRDKDGVDTTKVYFITKGKYELTREKAKTKAGYIYVSGWIDQDYIISGKITLIPDSGQYEVFSWNTQKPVKRMSL